MASTTAFFRPLERKGVEAANGFRLGRFRASSLGLYLLLTQSPSSRLDARSRTVSLLLPMGRRTFSVLLWKLLKLLTASVPSLACLRMQEDDDGARGRVEQLFLSEEMERRFAS